MPNPAPGFAKRPDHTVAIHTAQGTLVVELDTVSPRIAKSTSVLALEEASYPTVYYIPLADLNTDVIVASAKAYLSAVNKMLVATGKYTVEE